jgi:hypothetical protein
VWHWRGDLHFGLQFDSSDRQITRHFLISGFQVPGGVKSRKSKNNPPLPDYGDYQNDKKEQRAACAATLLAQA